MKSLLVSRDILPPPHREYIMGPAAISSCCSEAENGSGGRGRASILADTLEGV
jgi:hypothetical protein